MIRYAFDDANVWVYFVVIGSEYTSKYSTSGLSEYIVENCFADCRFGLPIKYLPFMFLKSTASATNMRDRMRHPALISASKVSKLLPNFDKTF